MANIESLEIELNTLKQQFSDFIGNSKQTKDLDITATIDSSTKILVENPTGGAKGILAIDLIKTLLLSLGLTEVNQDPAIGAWTFGEKAGINGGQFFIGKVKITTPPTTDAHIDFTYQVFE